MRVLYGVTGEGMGHATRSRVVIDYLLRQGHQVKVVVYGRAYHYLKRFFPDVTEITGLHISYANGAMDLLGSVALNAGVLPQNIARNAAVYGSVIQFAPQLVITDFEPFSYLYGTMNRLPVISIDNPQMINRCVHSSDIIAGNENDFRMADIYVALAEPWCFLYIITTFFYPQIKDAYVSNTCLVPPILRPEVLRARTSDGVHILVYQTSTSDEHLLDALRSIPDQRFIVYGLNKDPQSRQIQHFGNCILKPFDETGFINDLASSRAVVANGGMSLIGEALALGKPVYSVPVRNHFEQIMNARYLQKLGYGVTSEYFDVEMLGYFLWNLPHYTANVRSLSQQDENQRLFSVLDQNMVI